MLEQLDQPPRPVPGRSHGRARRCGPAGRRCRPAAGGTRAASAGRRRPRSGRPAGALAPGNSPSTLRLAAGRVQDAGQHLDRRRLAGPVRAEERDQLARLDRERDAVDRRDLARARPQQPAQPTPARPRAWKTFLSPSTTIAGIAASRKRKRPGDLSPGRSPVWDTCAKTRAPSDRRRRRGTAVQIAARRSSARECGRSRRPVNGFGGYRSTRTRPGRLPGDDLHARPPWQECGPTAGREADRSRPAVGVRERPAAGFLLPAAGGMSIPLRDYVDLLYVYLRPAGRQALLLAALLLTAIGLQLVNPQILRRFIDAAVAGAPLAAADRRGARLPRRRARPAGPVGRERLRGRERRLDGHQRAAARPGAALPAARHGLPQRRTPGELIERIDGDVTALANFFSQLVDPRARQRAAAGRRARAAAAARTGGSAWR